MMCAATFIAALSAGFTLSTSFAFAQIITGAVFLGRTGFTGAVFGAALIGVIGLGVAGVCEIADGGGPDVPIYRKPGLQLKGVRN